MLHLPLLLSYPMPLNLLVSHSFCDGLSLGRRERLSKLVVFSGSGNSGRKTIEWPNCRKHCSHGFCKFRCQSQSILRCSSTGKQFSSVLLLTEWLLRRKRKKKNLPPTVSFRLEQKVTSFLALVCTLACRRVLGENKIA